MLASDPLYSTLPASRIRVGWKLWDPLARLWREVLEVETTHTLINVTTSGTGACFRPTERAHVRK